MAPEPISDHSEAPLSEASRLAGVFFDPGKAFRDIAARPRWFVPMLIGVLAGVLYIYMFNHRVGWEHFMRQAMDSNARTAQLTPEQKEKALEMQLKFAPIGAFGGAILAPPLYTLAAAAVLLFIFNTLLSAGLKFKQVFSVMCYAGLTGVVFSLLAIGVMFLKNADDFNLKNPLAFNPAAFLDPLQTSKFLYAFLGSLDLFSFWTMALIAIGLSAAGTRLSFSKALVGVMIPWGLLVLVKTATAGIFG